MAKLLIAGLGPTGADRGRTRRALGGVCALCLLSIGHANADALSPALISGSVSFNFEPPAALSFSTFGTFAVSGPGGHVQATASGLPGPYLSGEETISKNFTGRAGGQLIYQIEVVGPPGAVEVLAQVEGGASGSSHPFDLFAGFDVIASWRLEDVTLGLAPVFSEGIDSGLLRGSFNETFGHTVDLTLTANHLYRVTMAANSFAAAGSSGTDAFGSAFIDPVFSFGPGVGPEYSLLISDGVGNSAAPEPASLLLSGGAIAALALFRRCRSSPTARESPAE